jgi:hypothetical protein
MNDGRIQAGLRLWSLWAIILLMPGYLLFPSELPGCMAPAEVAGVWDLTIESQEGTAHPVITLKQEGERITGSYEGKIGVRSLAGTIKGNEITFVVNLKFREVSYDVTYGGTVDNDSMKGTTRFGDAGSGSWTAKRRKNGYSAVAMIRIRPASGA